MGVEVSLKPKDLEVEPGESVECTLVLHNTGAVVDQFAVEIIGDTAKWGEAEPNIVNLFPDGETSITLKFSPLSSSDVKAGKVPFAVRIRSREDPEGSVIEEGSVTVAEYKKIEAEFVPHVTSGSFRTRHRLAVDNLGNADLSVSVKITDKNDALIFKLRQYAVHLSSGTTVLLPVRVIPKKRFLKGRERTRPFQAKLAAAGMKPVTADAAMVQRPLIPKWLFAGLMSLLALLAALLILSATVFKQTLQSDEGTAPSVQPTPTQNTAPPPGESPSASASASGSPSTPPQVIQANAAAGQSGTFQQFTYTVPNGQQFTLTDITLTGPSGSSGTAEVRHGSDTLDSQSLDSLPQTQHLDPSLQLAGGDQIVLAVDCHNPTDPCTPSAVLSGSLS
ncbi:hypothetical protein [Streptomyces sp. NPDC048419]|uniref:COG1470 family protein n=1 Tax=Streptomyces sp. NPDC048419 TaxID=3365547 RepID=UPI0037231C59